MLSDDLRNKLWDFHSYIPLFIQWNPITNTPKFPLQKDIVADGALYEVTGDADLIINNITFNLKKHDLIVRVNGNWEHVSILTRNRLRFEAFLKSHKKGVSKLEYDDNENVYNNTTIQNKWELWQAALSTTISG